MKRISFASPADVPANLIQQAQEGRWYHWKRLYFIQTATEVRVVALNCFQRLAAALLKVIRRDYFAIMTGEKSIKRLNPFAQIFKKDAPVEKPNPAVAEFAQEPAPPAAKPYNLDEQIQAIHHLAVSHPTKKICIFLGRGAEQTVPQHPDEIWISLDKTNVSPPLDPARIHLQMDFNEQKMAAIQHLFDKALLDLSVLKFFNQFNPWASLRALLKKEPHAELITETSKGLPGAKIYATEAHARAHGDEEGGGMMGDVYYIHINAHTPQQREACKRQAHEKANANTLQILKNIFQSTTLVRQQPFPCHLGLHDYFILKGPR